MDKMYTFACRLSNIQRFQGRRLRNPYNVAEHSYRVALLAMRMADEYPHPGIDKELVLKCALLHDVEESILGDIPAPYKKYFEDYANAEYNALKNEMELSSHYINVKSVYNDKTIEGDIVYWADKLEAFFTASYEVERGNTSLKKCYDELLKQIGQNKEFLDQFPYIVGLINEAVLSEF